MEEKNVTMEETNELEEETKETVEETVEESNETMGELMEEVDKTMTRINTGDILEGKVVSVDEEGATVDIGYHTEGIVLLNELSNKPNASATELVSPGDLIDVEVLKVDDGEGNVLLSKKRAEAIVAWDYVEKAQKDGEIIEVTVEEAVKGGVISDLKGIRAFIPASQLSDRYVEDISTFVGQTIRTEVIEIDRSKNRLILSARKLAKAARDEEKKVTMENLKVGDKKTGKVMKLVPFGAFVDIGGVEGLLHNQDLSWTRVKHPSEIIKEGQEIEVTVIKIDQEEGKVGLGYKDMTKDPWTVNVEALKKGSVVEGVVTKLVDFGAFVRIADRVEGLVHISQISDKRIDKPSDVLEEKQKVKVKILEINQESKRISLSMKEAQNAFDAELVKKYANSDEGGLGTIGDALGDAFKDLFN